MSYISTKETSKLWGISMARIVKLASEGRIEGAKLIGNSWLIPQNAKKPEDGRTRALRAMRNEPVFHFPFFLLGYYDEKDLAAFTKEELSLRQAQLLAESCQLEEASEILEKIINTSDNRTVLIGAYASIIFVCVRTGEYEKIENYYLQLQLLFAEDFPHKDELSVILYDVRGYLEGYDIEYLKSSHFSPDADICVEVQNYTSMLSLMAEVTESYLSNRAVNVTAYEMICRYLTRNNYYLSEIVAHFFLSYIYHHSNPEYQKVHLRKAISIAQEQKLYVSLADFSFYDYSAFESVLQEFPKETVDIFEKLHNSKNDYAQYLKTSGRTSCLVSLDNNDYSLIQYALKKVLNREIAEKEEVTEGTINKRYARLYSKLGISSKNELVDLAVSLVQKKA